VENKTIAEKKHKKQNRLITNYYIIKFFSGLYLVHPLKNASTACLTYTCLCNYLQSLHMQALRTNKN